MSARERGHKHGYVLSRQKEITRSAVEIISAGKTEETLSGQGQPPARANTQWQAERAECWQNFPASPSLLPLRHTGSSPHRDSFLGEFMIQHDMERLLPYQMAMINNYQMDVRSTPPSHYFNRLDQDRILCCCFRLQSHNGEEMGEKRKHATWE